MCRSHVVVAILAWFTLMDPTAAVESARIDTTYGAPRLLLDGQPARARIFWGGPGSRPLRVGETWQEIAFEFTAQHDEPQHGTMHLRFGQVPGEIILDEIRVASADGTTDVIPNCDFERGQADFSRNWTYWPQGPDNTVGSMQVLPGIGRGGSHGLRVQLKAPPDGNWPDFHIFHHPTLTLRKGERYRVTLWVQANPARDLSIAFYRPGSNYLLLGGPPNVLESQIRLAAAADVNLISFPVHMPWPAPGAKVDWDVVDQQCTMVLQANPHALLLPRIWVGAPAWWCQAHPDAVMKWDDNGPHPTDACVASPEFLRDASERLKALIEHLEARFGPHMVGYHPCGQNTGEWFYHDTWGAGLNGYSPASQIAWRKWLHERYVSDEALRQAWRDLGVTRANAEVPAPAARRAAPTGILRDPQTEQRLIDFAEFQQTMMANCVCHLARTVRQATQGKRLVLFFYGYVHEFGAIRNGPSTSGHYALRQALNCPDIDVLCSPISYFDRGLGESGPAMTAAESIALAGKMWLVEDDTYTYLGTGTFPGWTVGAKNIEDTNKLLLRNTAQCAVRNFATWWMDLGSAGWFDDPQMWQIMKQLKKLDQEFLDTPAPYQPEVAVVVDEASMLCVAAEGDAVTRPCVYEIRGPLARMGTPYGQYLLDDVIAGRVRAKLYVFANAWCLTPQQRRDLLKATAGSMRIWCYAPGYLEPGQTSLDGMRELTGLDLQRVSPGQALATPTEAGRQLGVNDAWGVAQAINPLFAPVDVQASKVLATYPDGRPAVALRGMDLFVGVPAITSQLLRAAARRAGVHLFVEQDCNVYANGRYVILHAATGGEFSINTVNGSPVCDYLSGEPLGNGPQVSVRMHKGDTRVLVIEGR